MNELIYGYVLDFDHYNGFEFVAPVTCEELRSLHEKSGRAIFSTREAAEAERRSRLEAVCPNYFTSLRKK